MPDLDHFNTAGGTASGRTTPTLQGQPVSAASPAKGTAHSRRATHEVGGAAPSSGRTTNGTWQPQPQQQQQLTPLPPLPGQEAWGSVGNGSGHGYGSGEVGGGADAQDAAPAPAPAPTPTASADVVLSVPCHLYGTLRNKEGTLVVYRDRLEFVVAGPAGAGGTAGGTPPLVRVALDEVEALTQRQGGGLMGLGGGTMLAVQVAGPAGAGGPLLFGGMTDALLASLKEHISDLL